MVFFMASSISIFRLFPACLSNIYLSLQGLCLIKSRGIRATVEWENHATRRYSMSVSLAAEPFVYPTRYEGLIFARGARHPLTNKAGLKL